MEAWSRFWMMEKILPSFRGTLTSELCSRTAGTSVFQSDVVVLLSVARKKKRVSAAMKTSHLETI